MRVIKAVIKTSDTNTFFEEKELMQFISSNVLVSNMILGEENN